MSGLHQDNDFHVKGVLNMMPSQGHLGFGWFGLKTGAASVVHGCTSTLRLRPTRWPVAYLPTKGWGDEAKRPQD